MPTHLLPAAITLIGMLAFIGWMTWLILRPPRSSAKLADLDDALPAQLLTLRYRQVLNDPATRRSEGRCSTRPGRAA